MCTAHRLLDRGERHLAPAVRERTQARKARRLARGLQVLDDAAEHGAELSLVRENEPRTVPQRPRGDNAVARDLTARRQSIRRIR